MKIPTKRIVDSPDKLFYVLVSLVGILVFSPIAEAQKKGNVWVTGCYEGSDRYEDQSFPQQSKGNTPNKYLYWAIILTKGEYHVRIASRINFEPFIYKKSYETAKYLSAGLGKNTRLIQDNKGRNMYVFDFRADHRGGSPNNYWLLRAKPKNQVRQHTIRVRVKHSNCGGSGKCTCEDWDNDRLFGVVKSGKVLRPNYGTYKQCMKLVSTMSTCGSSGDNGTNYCTCADWDGNGVYGVVRGKKVLHGNYGTYNQCMQLAKSMSGCK